MADKVGAKAGKPARKAKKVPSKAKRAKPAASRARSRAQDEATEKKGNAADALVSLLESPLVADLLAAGISAAAATVIEHKMKGKRAEGSLVRAVGAATAAAVGRQLAEELREMREAAKDSKSAK